MPDMSNDLFLSEQHPVSRRWAVFEDDGESAWLYLTQPDKEKPERACWIYNGITPPVDADPLEYAADGKAPPVVGEYAGPGALYSGEYPPEVRFLWSSDGESVGAIINGSVLGFLDGTDARLGAYSKNLARKGPWGEPWNEEVFHKVLGGNL
jgi:hypothetical protein